MKSILTFLKKNLYNIFLLLFVVIFFILNLCDIRYKLSVSQLQNNYCLIYILLSLLLSVVTFLICRKKKNITEEKIPKIFVYGAIVLGIVYLLLSPLFTGSDEHNHYYRIYEITDGVIVTPTSDYVGGRLPFSLSKSFENGSGNNTTIKYKDIQSMMNVELKESDKVKYGDLWTNAYNNTALYSPVQYFPQAIGFLIAKILNFGPYLIGLFGRLFNLAFYIMLGYFSLKIIPKAKLFYLLLLLSPNMLQCATTLSADAFTNIVFLLLIALIFKMCYSDKKIKRKEELLLLILSVVISLCKIVYLPIVFLILIINSKKFKNGNKEKIIFSA